MGGLDLASGPGAVSTAVDLHRGSRTIILWALVLAGAFSRKSRPSAA